MAFAPLLIPLFLLVWKRNLIINMRIFILYLIFFTYSEQSPMYVLHQFHQSVKNSLSKESSVIFSNELNTSGFYMKHLVALVSCKWKQIKRNIVQHNHLYIFEELFPALCFWNYLTGFLFGIFCVNVTNTGFMNSLSQVIFQLNSSVPFWSSEISSRILKGSILTVMCK